MSRRAEIIFLFLVFLVLGLVYVTTFGHDLVFDSRLLFAPGSFFGVDRPLADAFTAGFGAQTGREEVGAFYYRPLTSLTYLLGTRIWGLSPFGMRGFNLILFFLALLVLFYFLKGQGGPPLFPHLFLALFALFPLQIDHVLWVVGRADLLVLLFASLCLWSLDRFKQTGLRRFLLATLLFYLLGQFSKESMVFFLPVLLAHEVAGRGRITPFLHLGNLAGSAGFFLLKSQVVGSGAVSFYYLPSIWDNLKLALAALGYYFRSLVVPFDHELFITPGDTVRAAWLWWGAACVILLGLVLLWVRRRRELWFPFLTAVVFLFGHLALVFSDLSPYRASTRFLLFPLLGLLWLFARWLAGRPAPVRYLITGLLVLSFIPALFIHAGSYRDDAAFWRRMVRLRPDNQVFLYMSAEGQIQIRNYLEAEALLDRALAVRMDGHTTELSVTLAKARITYIRADYASCTFWLEWLKHIGTQPLAELEGGKLRARVLIAQGRSEEAEALLLRLMSRFRNREVYDLLLDLYLGGLMWERALSHEGLIARDFPSRFVARVGRLRSGFPDLDRTERIEYFLRYRNYRRALELIGISGGNMKQEIRIIRLLYMAGEAEAGGEAAARIAADSRDDPSVLNLLGYFYARELARRDEALVYFSRSLRVNPDQPAVTRMVEYLRGLPRPRGPGATNGAVRLP